MRFKRALLIAGVNLVPIPTAALAHHTLEARFNRNKRPGRRSQKDVLEQPHVRLYIEVKNESNAVTWEVDMGSPNTQLMAGWEIETFRHSDRVRAEEAADEGFSQDPIKKSVKHWRPITTGFERDT